MKLLALNWRDIRSPEAGSAEVHLHEILRRLRARGHEVTLLCSHFARGKSSWAEIMDGIRILRTGSWWNAHLSIPRAARRLLEAEPFDLVLDDVNKIPFFAPSWSTVPVVALFLHLLGDTVFLETNPIAATAIRLIEKRIGRIYRGTPAVAISRSTAEELEAAGLDRKSITIVPPGLDHGLYGPERRIKATQPTLLVVSRLKAYKRVDVAIRALEQFRSVVPDAELLVAGDGNERRRLEALAQRLGQQVGFLGSITQAEKASLMSRAHLTFNPSMKEGWGLVAVESMACGTPVIASDVPGHRDSVPEGGGILVPCGDPVAMAEAGLRLLLNAEDYGRARHRGSRWASKFSWDQAAEVFERVLCEVARKPRIGLPEPEEMCK